MTEKLDPLKLAGKRGDQLGRKMEQELKSLERASGGKEVNLSVDKPVENKILPEMVQLEKKEETVETAGAVEEKPKVAEVAEAKDKEKERLQAERLRQAVEKTRAEYIKSEAGAKKAEKEENKLTGIRAKIKEFFVSGITSYEGDKIRVPARQERISGAKKDKEETKKFSEEKKNAYEEAKKVFGKGLYDEKMKVFEEKIKTSGKEGGPMTPEDQEKALAELKFEVVKAAILDEKKTLNEARFAALPEKERGLCTKAMARYGQLPQWSKVLISAGAATGATLAFSSGVGFATIGGIYAWKTLRAGVGTTAGLLAGKGYNWAFDKIVNVKKIISGDEQKIINEIKGSLINKGEQKDSPAENKSEKKEEEFEKWFSGISASANQKLDDLATKEKRILLGKAIGQGVVIAGIAGLTSMGMEKGMASLSPDLAAKMRIRLASPENAPRANAAGVVNSSEGVPRVNVPGAEVSKVQEVLNLKIGARGPEGAIIDNFRNNPKLAEAFGYDPKGGVSLDKWAGTKAHDLWLKSVEGDLKNPKIVAELTKHGYQANPEDYAKAMHKIGKGVVELDLQGHVHLTDSTSFLKAAAHSAEAHPNIPMETLPKANDLLGVEVIADNKIKETVTRFVEPEILKDATFKAAAKVPLGKILEAVPPEAYADKYTLSRYWHSLGGAGVKTPDLPGSSWLGLTYDDFKKYSEMAKFLRENVEVKVGSKAVEGLRSLTVQEFLEKYGGDLGKATGK